MRFREIHLTRVAILAMGLAACRHDRKLFTPIAPSHSHIDFTNTIQETPEKNIITYEYYYNGGGVAAADFNNDGLCDLYFTGNSVENKLYLNKGGMQFEDVTDRAGVGGRADWKTGVTVVDINGDGWLDIYVSYSGPVKKDHLSEELYINNGCAKGGIPSFTEKAASYGLDAPFTFSTQSLFFDMDGDGDLDMFQCNHAVGYFSPFFKTQQVRDKRHPQFSNRLYRNDGGHFTDVSEQAGIMGGGLNFTLSACISDINNDGWPDIYVTNDFEEQDHLYLNTGKGTFTDVIKSATGHISKFSMGCDVADFNNDLLPDILVVDMLPPTLERQKMLKGPDEYDKYSLLVDSGFHHQNMRNTLQLNRGNGAGAIPLFSEIGELAGVYKTDWSWAALFQDLDNDGYKDIFITNGFLRDFTNLDFLKYTYQDAMEKAKSEQSVLPVYGLVRQMPSTRLANFVFRNNGDLHFSDVTQSWGMDQPMVSCGAVYADLDNDGDLDLVTNNTNEPASIWENHSRELLKNNFIQVKLKGKGLNSFGLGAKVYVYTDSLQQVQEMSPTRGFQSCVDYVLHFGLGVAKGPVRVRVVWPDQSVSTVETAGVNTSLSIDQKDAVEQSPDDRPASGKHLTPIARPLFTDVTALSGINWIQKETGPADFKRELLIPYQVSRSGPFLSSGDVNKDGLEDLFVSGGPSAATTLFIQRPDHRFRVADGEPFGSRPGRDMGSVFFDANGDGAPDLYVVNSAAEPSESGSSGKGGLFINNGKGIFHSAAEDAIPSNVQGGSCVAAADVDGDGDMDLFIGGGVMPGRFPFCGASFILRNDSDKKKGTVKFTDVTSEVNAALGSLGMVTNAVWTDLNGDHWPDLVVVGEWMPIRIFLNHQGKLEESKDPGLQHSSGLWSKVVAVDMDNDGDTDLVIGNAGMNGQWQPDVEHPMVMYAGDLDENGTIDPIICEHLGGKDFPVASFDEMIRQIPSVQKKFIHYKDYAKASAEEIFTPGQLATAKKWVLETLQTVYLENIGNGHFRMHSLPREAQFSRVNGILSGDYDHDGHMDLLLTGNYFDYRVQYGRADASYGLLLTGNGQGNYRVKNGIGAGLIANGDIRDAIELKSDKSDMLVFGKNGDGIQVVSVP